MAVINLNTGEVESELEAVAKDQSGESFEERALRLGAKKGISLSNEDIAKINAGETIQPKESELDADSYFPRSEVEKTGSFQTLANSLSQGLMRLPVGALIASQEALGAGDPQSIARKMKNMEEYNEIAGSESPYSKFIGEAVGETASFPFGGGGKTLLTRAMSSIPVAAGGGGVSEYGRTGGDIEQATQGAMISGALGPLGEVAGEGANRLIKGVTSLVPSKNIPLNVESPNLSQADVLERMDQLKSRGMSEEGASRQARAELFGTTLSKGQAERSFEAAELEDILKGQSGTQEGTAARAFFAQQQKEIIDAKDQIIKQLTNDITLSREQRGEIVQTTLREIDQAEKEYVSSLYKMLPDVEGGDIRLRTEPLKDLSDQLIRTYVPSESMQKGIKNIFEDFSGKETPTSRGALSFSNAEEFRKRLNALPATNNAEFAVVSQMKSGIDNLLNGAVEQFPQGSAIKSAAEEARKAASSRKEAFNAKDIVEKITSYVKGTGNKTDKVPPARVIESILQGGNSKIENIKRVKAALFRGTNKEGIKKGMKAWQEIQGQAVIDILSKAVSPLTGDSSGFLISGQRLNTSFDKFGEDALKELLTAKQLKMIKDFKGLVGDATIPVPRTVNNSNSAGRLMNMLSRIAPIGDYTAQITGLIDNLISQGKTAAEARATLKGIYDPSDKTATGRSMLSLLSGVNSRNSAANAMTEKEEQKQ